MRVLPTIPLHWEVPWASLQLVPSAQVPVWAAELPKGHGNAGAEWERGGEGDHEPSRHCRQCPAERDTVPGDALQPTCRHPHCAVRAHRLHLCPGHR